MAIDPTSVSPAHAAEWPERVRELLDSLAKPFDLYLLGESSPLRDCTLTAWLEDTMLLTSTAGTYLVPWAAVGCVKLAGRPPVPGGAPEGVHAPA